MPQPKPEVGYNIQMTKCTDRAGGGETITINTAVGPEASEVAIYDRIQKMAGAMQRRIAQTVAAEERRQEAERKGLRLAPGLATPESLPPSVAPHENGHDLTDA